MKVRLVLPDLSKWKDRFGLFRRKVGPLKDKAQASFGKYTIDLPRPNFGVSGLIGLMITIFVVSMMYGTFFQAVNSQLDPVSSPISSMLLIVALPLFVVMGIIFTLFRIIDV